MDLEHIQQNAELSDEPIDRARQFASRSKANSTVRAYGSAWTSFVSWCRARGVEPLPATSESIALYVADRAGDSKPSTLNRYLAAIASAHRLAGHASPIGDEMVRAVMAGIRRTVGTAQRGKDPLLIGHMRAIVETLPEGRVGLRDRALLLLGFAGAFRRSELVALDVEDLRFRDEGMVVFLRRSKTDQEGRGREVAIPCGVRESTCPVQAMRRWLEHAGISSGPVFRGLTRGKVAEDRLSTQGLANAVKRAAASAGLDVENISAHSLRAGFATTAIMAGVPEHLVMRQTGHKSTTVFRRYVRDGSLFRDNAAGMVGL